MLYDMKLFWKSFNKISPSSTFRAGGGRNSFRKATDQRVQEFRRAGAFLPDTPQSRIRRSGGFSAPWRYLFLILSLPMLPLPCSYRLKDHFSSSSFNSWKLKLLFFEISWSALGYSEIREAVRNSGTVFNRWSKRPIWRLFGERGYLEKQSAKPTRCWS